MGQSGLGLHCLLKPMYLEGLGYLLFHSRNEKKQFEPVGRNFTAMASHTMHQCYILYNKQQQHAKKVTHV